MWGPGPRVWPLCLLPHPWVSKVFAQNSEQTPQLVITAVLSPIVTWLKRATAHRGEQFGDVLRSDHLPKCPCSKSMENTVELVD